MSMGHMASFADTIPEESLRKLFPKEYKAFEVSLESVGGNLDELAEALKYEDNVKGKVSLAYIKLIKAFHKKYKVELSLGYHSVENNGDCYDEVDGAYWWVSHEMWEVKKSVKPIAKFIDRKFFVNYG